MRCMKVNEYMKLHDKIARQNRIIYSSSESIAMAMSPSIIELVDNINRMMKVIPPPGELPRGQFCA